MEELVQTPLWILATPLYWYSVSAQAKTFLDRLSDLLVVRKDLGRALCGRSFAVVCSGADASPPSQFVEPLQLTCDYLGMRFLGVHYAQFVDGKPTTPNALMDAARFGNAIWKQLPQPISGQPPTAAIRDA